MSLPLVAPFPKSRAPASTNGSLCSRVKAKLCTNNRSGDRPPKKTLQNEGLERLVPLDSRAALLRTLYVLHVVLSRSGDSSGVSDGHLRKNFSRINNFPFVVLSLVCFAPLESSFLHVADCASHLTHVRLVRGVLWCTAASFPSSLTWVSVFTTYTTERTQDLHEK